MGRVDIGARVALQQLGERRRAARRVARDDLFDALEKRQRERCAVSRAVFRKHHFRPYCLDRMPQPRIGVRHERILFRERNDRNTHILRGKREKAVVDTVAGDDGDRRFRSESTTEQS